MLEEEFFEEDSAPQRRIRTLTEKAQANFDEEYQRHSNGINSAYDNLAKLLDKIPTSTDVEEYKLLELSIHKSAAVHQELSEMLIGYCKRTQTLASMDSARSQRITLHGCNLLVETAIKKIRDRIEDLSFDNRSSASRASRTSRSSSHKSNLSTEIAKSKAKAEAAKAKLKYVTMAAETRRKQNLLDEQQPRVNREKADLSTELEIIEATQEVAAAQAEAEALETFDHDGSVSDSAKPSNQMQLPTETVNAQQRTNDYVDKMSQLSLDSVEKDRNNNDSSGFVKNNDRIESTCKQNPVTSDFTKYLLKKDLLLNRLSPFDDRPESYLSWKMSFRSVMQFWMLFGYTCCALRQYRVCL